MIHSEKFSTLAVLDWLLAFCHTELSWWLLLLPGIQGLLLLGEPCVYVGHSLRTV